MEKSEYISSKLNIPTSKIDSALDLFSQGATVPFVARYRREVTGGLDENQLRGIESLESKFDELSDRKETVLNTIEGLGKLTPELKARIDSCDNLTELEDIYRPYKPKRETRGSKAVKAGLEPLMNFILTSPFGDLNEVAKNYICENYKTVEECIQGALDILAERISDNEGYRKFIKSLAYKSGIFEISKVKDSEVLTYDNYVGLRLGVATIKGHQVLAISRGEREKVLKKALLLPKTEIVSYILAHEKPKISRYGHLIEVAVEDSFDRLILPSVTNDVWGDLLDKAKEEALSVFSKNLRDILLFPPLMGKTIMGFDPGYAHGCKICVISSSNDVLATSVVYPTLGKGQRYNEALKIIADLIRKYKVQAIALGNGTASRESADFLKEVISTNGFDTQVIVVSEAGASVYSATPLAEKEFPDYDVNLRSSVSIARRLEDPLAELVKIPPEAAGVGQYQHDMDQKGLKENLGKVVEDCVNYVGVNLNTASVSLLSYVSGVSSKLAQSVIDFRTSNGPFKNREQLHKVKGFGPVAFKNAAGFLRVKGDEPFDDTGIHPESYEIARHIVSLYGIDSVEKAQEFLKNNNENKFIEVAGNVGSDPYTVKLVIEELSKPGRDPRGNFKTAKLSNAVHSIEDLKVGMVLEGTVRNIADFGAFVDLGVHKDGLVHVSEIANRRISKPSDVLHVGQVVKVEVLDIDVKRQRISLSIKKALDKETNV